MIEHKKKLSYFKAKSQRAWANTICCIYSIGQPKYNLISTVTPQQQIACTSNEEFFTQDGASSPLMRRTDLQHSCNMSAMKGATNHSLDLHNAPYTQSPRRSFGYGPFTESEKRYDPFTTNNDYGSYNPTQSQTDMTSFSGFFVTQSPQIEEKWSPAQYWMPTKQINQPNVQRTSENYPIYQVRQFLLTRVCNLEFSKFFKLLRIFVEL